MMMKINIKQWCTQTFLLLAVLAVSSVQAAGNAEAGKSKVRSCQICHGAEGVSTNPAYPILAGQHAKYLVKQLKAFRNGTRKDPIMNGMSASLSDQEMEDIAAFFEGKHLGALGLR
ncbi:Cytochrome c4 [hydrothermal vent metagenome]|uniref:Cytochrome c4 n=1 Tax=hydrothermal vent metagenome TaxID=652676 RepID=A0A3B1A2T0_9ZZZZ